MATEQVLEPGSPISSSHLRGWVCSKFRRFASLWPRKPLLHAKKYMKLETRYVPTTTISCWMLIERQGGKKEFTCMRGWCAISYKELHSASALPGKAADNKVQISFRLSATWCPSCYHVNHLKLKYPSWGGNKNMSFFWWNPRIILGRWARTCTDKIYLRALRWQHQGISSLPFLLPLIRQTFFLFLRKSVSTYHLILLLRGRCCPWKFVRSGQMVCRRSTWKRTNPLEKAVVLLMPSLSSYKMVFFKTKTTKSQGNVEIAPICTEILTQCADPKVCSRKEDWTTTISDSQISPGVRRVIFALNRNTFHLLYHTSVYVCRVAQVLRFCNSQAANTIIIGVTYKWTVSAISLCYSRDLENTIFERKRIMSTPIRNRPTTGLLSWNTDLPSAPSTAASKRRTPRTPDHMRVSFFTSVRPAYLGPHS